jgi:hypothetical protein
MATVSKISMSRHAEIRSQQRSIPPLIVDWLVQFGAETYDGRGAMVRHFDRPSLRQLEKHVGRSVVSRLSELLDAYVVTDSDGTIITVGHRFKRVSRH